MHAQHAETLTSEDYAYSSLAAYSVYQWGGYRVARHHQRICRALEAVEEGRIKRLMIFMPPRHGKSMLASENFPPWYLGRNPDKYVIHATYGQELADDFGRKVRNQVQSQEFKAIFPGSDMAQDSAAAKRFNMKAGGSYFALGVGGPATGRGADVLLIDDPIKGREEAESDTQRNKLKDWYRSVAYTRLMPGGAIVIIQTRWHDDDLAGWLLREHKEEGWTVISMPAIDDEGRALWPEAYPVERLEQIKLAVGSRDWNALYQQRPTPEEGGLIKLGWFNREIPFHDPRLYQRIVASWDTAQKEKEVNDYSVCTVWGETKNGAHLLHVERARLIYPELRDASVRIAKTWKPSAILIEDKASGVSLSQELRAATRLPVIKIEPCGDKVVRAMRVSPAIEAGLVTLPPMATWLPEFELEVSSFPYSAHDDQVDSMTQYLNWANLKAAEVSIEPFGAEPIGAW